MSQPRLVLVSRKYWPLVGCVESAFATLAREFHCRGIETTVLTAQWEKNWPTEVVHQDVRVVRVPSWRQSGWGTLRYLGALSRWLRSHASEFDLVYVSGLKYDAHSAVGALRKSNSLVVLRADEGGAAGDCRWQETARFGRRIRRRCQSAHALLTQSDSIAAELLSAGYARDKIQTVGHGVEARPTRDAASRSAARKALSKAHEILSADENTPLAVYIGPFYKSMGLMELVESWKTVSARIPEAKLWLLGEGPDGLAIWERVNELGLTYQVIFPGTFDDVTDVLLAADVFVHPAKEDGAATAILDAMACSVPVLAGDTTDTRDLLATGERGLITKTTPESLAKSILDVLQDPTQLAPQAQRARQHVQSRYSLDRSVDEHLAAFERIMAAKPSS